MNLDDGARQLAEKAVALARPLADGRDLDPLIAAVGDARFVLLGEASHGTSDFYAWRARLSQRLIREQGFSFVAVEGDWPDCYRINRYVKGYPEAGGPARQLLRAFERWPTWMWANWEVAAFAEWLRGFNAGRETERRAGFYGLDVYSLWESMGSIIRYLEENDGEAARLARQAYACFEPYGEDVHNYAWATRMVPELCEDEVIELLTELRQSGERYDSDREAAFNAEQNAHVLVNAERYYRAMVRSDRNSWNLRDEHMMDTLDRLMQFHGPGARGIVWAHNTHVGDARYTDMGQAGMFNIGQLARQRHAPEGVVLVGFGSQRGSVIAGRAWGAPLEQLAVPPAQPGSWEDVLHQNPAGDHLLLLGEARGDEDFLAVRGHRAIGVVYNPEREQLGNYVPTVLPHRYDAFLFIDRSAALHPLHLEPEGMEVPDTYPWGL
ncbi:MAG TPA: erythromycin esterase family protein [Anaerolineaceae bacterium]|nr:erythromycin esterase family protein [Anaerolineaceae bacterium]